MAASTDVADEDRLELIATGRRNVAFVDCGPCRIGRCAPQLGGAGTTTWTLELPQQVNVTSLNRITDVRITFDVQAAYEMPSAAAVPLPQSASRATFVSALAIDATGLTTLRNDLTPQAEMVFDLDRLALPEGATITNLAVLLPGVTGGTVEAKLKFGSAATKSFQIDDGLAMSNAGALSDGNPANVQPLNAAASGSPARPKLATLVLQRVR